jgi:drug/metabolite transporter (DMT)-like permease
MKGSKMNALMAVVLLVMTQMVMLVYTKKVMNQAKLPLFLCEAQFLVSAALSALILIIRRPEKRDLLTTLSAPPHLFKQTLIPLSICWTLGFVLFNASAALMSPAHVNLVRCGEPLATVVIGLLVMGKKYRPQVLWTLVPIVGGVLVASSGGTFGNSLSMYGVLLACCSNASFCFRPFVLHKLKLQTQGEPLDHVLVFFTVTVIASFVVLPVCVTFLEGMALTKAFGGGHFSLSFWGNVLMSSISFFCYQLTQLKIMSLVDPLTFSILTPVVKAIMIVTCSWYFGDSFGLLSAFGVITTTGGGYLFTRVVAATGGAESLPQFQDRGV